MDRIPDCTGVVVAGGRALRMGGTPKGLLRLGGETLAARTVALFRSLFGEVLVSTADPEPWTALGAQVVPDVIAGRGAPGGLHAALGAARTGWIFAAGCDMPFLAEAPIRFLAARRGDAAAVLVEWERGLEGLHGFWSRRALPVVERSLREGEPSLRELAVAVGAAVVPAAEWRPVDPLGRSFENANTPEDLARLGLLRPGPPSP
ncbi:MAG TPA: molybdenum cofactor guanylyltransferase [Anaeromyxobacteraceae bacterium]|nr:molybdenum cofactor guanylyltransferase [Anaeromyxobacteraceae bacterium]